MAKKPNEDLPALVVPELVTISVDLDKDDVAAILMSRAEEHLKSAIRTCHKQERVLGKEAADLEMQLEKQLQNVADAHFEETVDTLKEAAAALKAKSIEACVSHNSYAMQSGNGKNGQPIVHCALSVTGQKPRVRFEVTQGVRMPAAVKATLADIKAKEKAAADNKKDWMDHRRKLADLPTIERRAKAAVAEQRLKATDEGRALIEMLDDQLDNSIKLLGVS